VNVLYVSHTSQISGAERSLLDLLRWLPDDAHPSAAAPAGPLRAALGELGIPTSKIMGTTGSLRLHPLHTPRALGELAVSAWQLRRAVRALAADIVHANSIRAGIILALARLPGVARVVHVRDCLPHSAASSAAGRLVAATADAVVANSHYTAEWFRAGAPAARLVVVHNGVDLQRFDPHRVDGARARAAVGPALEGRLVLGVVAQLSPWKGQACAIEALAALVRDGVDAHLLLIGSVKFRDPATRLDNEAYVRRLRERIDAQGLCERVSWLGEREDVPELLAALDVLLLPSAQEPFGRALIEAMALGVPVIATDVGGPREIVRDGEEGLLLAPDEPREWAAAIRRLGEDEQLRARMGASGRRRVQDAFSADANARAMGAVYDRALARRASRS
jgi:glycosyltransferase involved in cell wall biosynthesis